MLSKKWAILAKIESSYGVDVSPSITDLIYTSNPSIDVQTKVLERTHPKSGYGKNASSNIGESVKIGFSMEVQSDWVAATDTVPTIGKILRACNFTETITTGDNIAYQNNSVQEGESLTLWIHKDGLLSKITGCRGEVKGSHTAGEKITIDFEFEGIYKTGYQTEATFPVFTVSLDNVSIFQNAEVAIGAFDSPKIQKFNWGMGNVLTKRPDANSDKGLYSTYISDAVPTVSLDPEIIAFASFNARALWESDSLVTVVGKFKDPSSGTKFCTITMQNMQYKDVKDGEREGIMTYDLNLECGGDADVALKFEG